MGSIGLIIGILKSRYWRDEYGTNVPRMVKKCTCGAWDLGIRAVGSISGHSFLVCFKRGQFLIWNGEV